LLEGKAWETNWDGFWQAKTAIDASGWTAEFAIPDQTISFAPSKDEWDFNVHRVVMRLGERTRWSDDRPSRSILEVGLAGTLGGMRDLDLGLGLEVSPSFTSRLISDPNGHSDNTLDGGWPSKRGSTASISAKRRPAHRPLSASLLAAFGRFYDGYQTRVVGSVSWRPYGHYIVSPEYVFRDLYMSSGKQEVHLARLRLILQFSADVSWVSLIQWDDVSNNIGINTRFRWIIEDGREIFIVLNQDLDTSDDIGNITRGRTEPLIKLEWAFRF
jgi:hypothetical protein